MSERSEPNLAAIAHLTGIEGMGSWYPTAVHEAGHCVVALAVGVPVQWVTIWPDGDSLGRVSFGPCPTDETPRVFLERRVIATLGGPAAHRRFCPGTNVRVGGSEDREKATAMSSVLGTSLRAGAAFRRFAAAEAAAIVERRSHAILHLAAALHVRKSIGADDISAIVAESDERQRASRPTLDKSVIAEILAEVDAGIAEAPTPTVRRLGHDIDRAAFRVLVDAAAAGHDSNAGDPRACLVEELYTRRDAAEVGRRFDAAVGRRRRQAKSVATPAGTGDRR